MKTLLIAASAVVALTWGATVGLIAAAIWTSGQLSARLNSTGALMFCIAALGTVLLCVAWSEVDR